MNNHRQVVIVGLVALVLSGCGESNESPKLPYSTIRTWPIPVQGKVVPAPRTIAVGHDDEVYVLDTAGRVVVYDPEGQVLRQWMMPEYEVGKPEGLCMLHDGRIVVADTHYHRIVIFDNQGKVLEMRGKHGTATGEYIYPVAVIEDPGHNLYVAEYGSNDRIQKYDSSGNHITSMGSFGTKPGAFQRPSGMVWHADHLYVADAINNRIQVFTDDGNFVGVLKDGKGVRPQLHFPYDICLGPSNHLFVVEYGAGRVTKLGLDGTVVGRFGSTGRGRGQFSTPWGLAVDGQDRLRVADTGNRRIVELVY